MNGLESYLGVGVWLAVGGACDHKHGKGEGGESERESIDLECGWQL